MSDLLKFMLAAHVLLGIVGIIAFYAVWMGLLKRRVNIGFLKWSALAGFSGFILSWLSGGYYYVDYYGSSVKPVILQGPYPLAHIILTETKEHVFLFLPFLALVITLALWFYGEKLENEKFKKTLAAVAAAATLLGAFIAVAGVAISGAAR